MANASAVGPGDTIAATPIRLSVAGAVVDLQFTSDTARTRAGRSITFLAPPMSLGEPDGAEPDLRVVVRTYEELPLHRRQPVRSTRTRCNEDDVHPLWAMRHVIARDTDLVDVASECAFLLHHHEIEVEAFVGADPLVFLTEFIGHVVWAVAVGRGAVMLHAAAVTVDGTGVVIAGRKGAGKTTTMLDLLDLPGVEFLSGEDLFLTTGGQHVLASGFPYWPHVGWGTLSQRPGLISRLQRALGALLPCGPPAEKVLLSPHAFQEAAGYRHGTSPSPIALLVLPDVNAGGPPRVVDGPPVDVTWVEANLKPTAGPPEGGSWQPYLATIVSPPVEPPHPTLLEDLTSTPVRRRLGMGPLSDTDLRRLLEP